MDKINESVKRAFDRPYVSYIAIAVGILYAVLLAPNLPPKVAQLFGQNLFNLIVLFLIAYISVSNITVALVFAVGFIVSIQTFNRMLVQHHTPMMMTSNMSNGDQQPSQVLQQVQQNKNEQMVLPPDTGFETGTVQNGCYGSITGLQGY